MKYELEMEISLENLAKIFEDNDWQYANGIAFGHPDADDLRVQIWTLMQMIHSSDGAYDWIRSGRIGLFQDPEVHNSYEIYLQLGTLSPDEPEFGEMTDA